MYVNCKKNLIKLIEKSFRDNLTFLMSNMPHVSICPFISFKMLTSGAVAEDLLTCEVSLIREIRFEVVMQALSYSFTKQI